MTETHDSVKETLPEGAQRGPQSNLSLAKLRRIGVIALGVALLIAIAGIVDREIKAHEVARWTDEQAVPSVSVVAPQRGGNDPALALPGNISAWYEAPIYARVSGYLKQWNFDYGAHVKRGQVLATIETPDLDAQFAASKADLEAAKAKVNVAKAAMGFAKTTYDRWRDSPKGVVSVQETESKRADYETGLASYDAAEAGVRSDQGVVDRLQALEQFKGIVAPFDGVVTQRNTDIGALINAGSGAGSPPQLFRIADVHEMRVFVQVPQAMSGGVKDGMTAELELPQYPERQFKAVVATTASAIDPVSRTLLVELHADNPEEILQPGTYSQVRFNLDSNPNVLRIPATALIFQQGGMQVAVLGPGSHAQMKSVTLGRNFGTEVEVVRGLSPADRVINSPPDSLSNGELVSVVSPTAASGNELASTSATVAPHNSPATASGSGATGASQ